MTLTQLQAFLAAANLGTFTKAADSLKMSQPAVSDLVRRLEQELGARLFNRGSRALILTEAGQQLLPHAEQAVASAEQGARAVQSQLELGGGTASFGLMRNADFYLAADLALAFHSRFPQVKIRLVGQNSAETADDVAAGVLEAGLVTLPIQDEGLEVVPLARDEILFVTAEEKKAKKPRRFSDFVDDTLVLYDAHYAQTDPTRRQLHERAQLAGKSLEPAVEVEYLGSAMTLVQAGVGDSIVCKAAAASAGIPSDLHTHSFSEPMYETLALVKRRGLLLSPATRQLAIMAWEALYEQQSGEHGTVELIVDRDRLRRFFDRPM